MSLLLAPQTPAIVFGIPTTIAASEIELWWDLDEGSGATATDKSGNGNTGTLVGSPAWDTSGPSGLPDRVVFVRASNHEITTSFNPNVATGTLCVWLELDQLTDRQTFVDYGNVNGQGTINLRETTNEIVGRSWGGNIEAQYAATTGSNKFICYRYFDTGGASDLAAIFENAVSKDATGPENKGTNTNTTHNFNVGANSGSSQHLDGKIAQVMFFNTSLDDAEISDLYQLGAGAPFEAFAFA